MKNKLAKLKNDKWNISCSFVDCQNNYHYQFYEINTISVEIFICKKHWKMLQDYAKFEILLNN